MPSNSGIISNTRGWGMEKRNTSSRKVERRKKDQLLEIAGREINDRGELRSNNTKFRQFLKNVSSGKK